MRQHIKSLLLISIVCFASGKLLAQQITNQISGRIFDKVSQQSLPGATIIVIGSDPILGTTTDLDGYFTLESIPIGRVSLQVTYLGYEPLTLQDQLLTGSKALDLRLEMVESVQSLDVVEITAEDDKREAINKMATVSARTFSIEEAERFAGARADVARMASNYAGVRGANDATNDIIIRGNSSSGLLWRLNGVDIPNPNHFGDLGATGGPVSMLNSNVLSNSDFITAAFPADYGNATSGVFDLKMRNGNTKEHQFLYQVGFNGFELGAEGPLNRQSHASYLVNARYSTLAVMKEFGMNFGTGTAVPEYQDMTFNINLPTKKAGSFQLFGVGGISTIDLLGSEIDTADAEALYGSDNLDIYDQNRMAVGGVNHRITLGEKSYSNLTLAYTHFNASEVIDSVNRLTREPCDCDWYLEDERNDKVFAHWFIGTKLNARNSLKYGVIANHLMFGLNSTQRVATTAYDTLSETNGSTQLIQPYIQWQWRATENLTINPGVHVAYLTLNDDVSVEPRLGARYRITSNHAINAGYGLHSRMQSMQLLFNEKWTGTTYEAVNKDLGFTKSHHAVIGHDWSLPKNWRLKSEVYYQYIFDAPKSTIDPNVNAINFPSNPSGFPDSLENYANTGEGRNYGLEFTIEKFMTKGFYTLATISLYRSEYKGAGGKWLSTAWDGGYVFNVLGGKEFDLNKNKVDRKRQLYFLTDLKFTYAGGQPVVPIDFGASQAARETVYNLSNGYSEQLAEYMRLDMNVGFKVLGRKVTQEFFVIMQNLTNQQNAFYRQYDAQSNSIRTINQLGLFVVPTYRITF